MCTRFVYNGKETIVGFNFDIDLSEWEHTVIAEKDRFFIGIKMSDNKYHSFHGINRNGRVLIIEPGIGYRLEKEKYSLITNYSILKPELTNPYVLSGDNRYEKAKDLLQGYGENFSISNAFDVLRSVRQEGLWATRVSFIYSVAKNKVYYVLNNDFKNIAEYQF